MKSFAQKEKVVSSSWDHKSPVQPTNFYGNHLQYENFSSGIRNILRKPDNLSGYTVSQPGDTYEQEADRVAEQVMRMPETGDEEEVEEEPVQTKLMNGGEIQRQVELPEDDEEEVIQTKKVEQTSTPEYPSLAAKLQSLKGQGQPLSEETRAFFEPRFREDFSQVRMHTDGKANETAKGLNAKAFTIGRDISFGHGYYAPETKEGGQLLAHELTHVVQTNSNRLGVIHRTAKDGLDSKPVIAGPDAPTTPGKIPAELERSQESVLPQSCGPGPSGGKPDPSIPNYTAVMGGRQVDYWAAKIIRAQHTFINFKLDSSHYWLVEGGPLPNDPKKSGAWAKFGEWDTRGERARKTFRKEECMDIKKCLLETTAKYHLANLDYDPTGGPNSNSFTEQLTYKCNQLPKRFIIRDIAWDYWTKTQRPF